MVTRVQFLSPTAILHSLILFSHFPSSHRPANYSVITIVSCGSLCPVEPSTHSLDQIVIGFYRTLWRCPFRKRLCIWAGSTQFFRYRVLDIEPGSVSVADGSINKLGITYVDGCLKDGALQIGATNATRASKTQTQQR
jgi:hypothetical protein